MKKIIPQLSFILCLCAGLFSSCERDKDIIDRTEPLQIDTNNTIRTVITENGISRDTIYWLFDDSTKRVPYAAYSQRDGVQKKLLSVFYQADKLHIDDGETGELRAEVTFEDGAPLFIDFYDRKQGNKMLSTYGFKYDKSSVPYKCIAYADTTPPGSAYGFVFSSNFKDNIFTDVPWAGITGDSSYLRITGQGTSIYNLAPKYNGFVPFVCTVPVTSTLFFNAGFSPIKTTGNSSIIDAYIWSVLMQPHLTDKLMLSYEKEQFFRFPAPKETFSFTLNHSGKKVSYTDGYTEVTNIYP